MDGWTDGQTDRWTDGCTYIYSMYIHILYNYIIYVCIHTYEYRQTIRQTDRHT